MSSPFGSLRTIKQGDPGSPASVNSPLAQLDAGIRYIEQLVRDYEAGQFIAARRVKLDAATAVGSPVYWNNDLGGFAPAYLSVNSAEGLYSLAPNARVQGIVITKETSTAGTVMLYGMKKMSIAAAVESATEPGYYYLSNVPGKLTATAPLIAVPVLMLTTDGNVILVNRVDDALDRHIHREFNLTCLPAGDHVPPGTGNPHVITNADADLPGWLPADHAVFEGKAPPGAVFGYNLSQDAVLGPVWPPDPVEACKLVWDKGVNPEVSGTVLPEGYTHLYIADENGLWWLSDCEGDVPWPETYNSGDDSTSYSDDPAAECPRHLSMSLKLYSTFPLFDATSTVVTSLRSVDDRLVIRCLGTTTSASRGDLEIDLDLSLGVATEDSRGATVLKGLADDTFSKGKMLEGLYRKSTNIVLTSDLPTIKRIPGDSSSDNVYQGMVGISVTPQATLELPSGLIRLQNVLEQFYADTPYLGMPAGRACEIRVRMDIPSDFVLTDPQLQLRLLVLGRAAGTLPSLTVTARRVAKPADGLATPLLLPDDSDEFSVTIDTTGTLTLSNQYVEAVSDGFEVAPGDIVFLTVSRAADDAYTNEVGLLATTGILSSAS